MNIQNYHPWPLTVFPSHHVGLGALQLSTHVLGGPSGALRRKQSTKLSPQEGFTTLNVPMPTARVGQLPLSTPGVGQVPMP